MNRKRFSVPIMTVVGIIFLSVTVGAQVQINVTEHQISFAFNVQTTPVLGRDNFGDYIVYTSYTITPGQFAPSDIYYQRLTNGQPMGNPVPVAVTSADERLPDASGDYIVYTDFPQHGSVVGKIKLYKISTAQTFEIDSYDENFNPKINGDVVVWLKYTTLGNLLLMYRISSGQIPTILAGPDPNPRSVEVGERLLVWSQWDGTQFDLVAYDILKGTTLFVANNPNLEERGPSTNGLWVTYEVFDRTSQQKDAIHAHNLDTKENRIIADNGSRNLRPRIDGNLISYESNVSGNWNIYLYRIVEGDTFHIMNPQEDLRLNDILGNQVAYIKFNGENQDVFVSTFAFNILPIANAGADQSVHVNSLVSLDGSGCSDPDGNVPLSYSWSFLSRPDGSAATFSNPASVNPTLVVDQPGDYLVKLLVTDSMGGVSQPDQVVISTENSAPIAEAGPDQAITRIGTAVQLDGTQSYDPDNDPLTYEWSFASVPSGSIATLFNSHTATPKFLADIYGAYWVHLVVKDPWTQSGDIILVSFENVQPVASAGISQSVRLGETVTLDGSSSSDPNSDPLTYRWAIASFPAGSGATIANPTAMNTTFVPDLAGNFIMQLVVHDGLLDSIPSTIQIQVVANPTAAIEVAQDAQVSIASLNPAVFKNASMQKTFNNKLNAVIADIEAGNISDALDKLEHDILAKTDGCATSGSADNNDWVKDCVSQGQVYIFILEVIEILRGL